MSQETVTLCMLYNNLYSDKLIIDLPILFNKMYIIRVPRLKVKSMHIILFIFENLLNSSICIYKRFYISIHLVQATIITNENRETNQSQGGV